MGRSGNPAKRAQSARKPEPVPPRRRCVYCGVKTRCEGESTQGARLPHSPTRQQWVPLCAEALLMQKRWAPHRQHLLSQRFFAETLAAVRG
jgi:hypothetical protein